MLNCIIIDDEAKARNAFTKIIARYFADKLKVVATAASVKEGVREIHRHNPDIVFLDIEMPKENGFKLFDYFKKFDFEVIFTTAYNQYAIEAIKFAALDYLLKPINYLDLMETLKRYEEKHKNPMNDLRIKTLVSNLLTGSVIEQKIALPTMEGYQMVKLNEIVYCEADESYCNIHLVNTETIVVPKTLKEIEKTLSDEIFFRIHKSYLVNLNYVSKYIKVDGSFVILEDGTELDVAIRRKNDFIRALTQTSFKE